LMEGEEQMFLNPLPVHLLPGLEREDLLSMRDFRLFKVRQLVEWTFPQLETIFKNRAGFIYQTARGIDETDVLPAGQRPPVASGERDFGDDTNDVDVIESALYAIVEKICFEIRERRLAARRVNVAIDYSDGGRIKRGLALPRPTSNDSKVFEAVKKALAMAWTRRARIRHIKITADRLVYPSALSDMFAGMDEAESSNNRLIKAVDDIRRKFGSDALQMGRTFKMNER